MKAQKTIFAALAVVMMITGCATAGHRYREAAEAYIAKFHEDFAQKDYDNADSDLSHAWNIVNATHDIAFGNTYPSWAPGMFDEIDKLYQQLRLAERVKKNADEQEETERLAPQIEVYSEVAGTVLLNGQPTEYTVPARGTVTVITPPLKERESITPQIAVRNSKGTLFPARREYQKYDHGINSVRWSELKLELRRGEKGSAYVEDPSFPANPDDFIIVQNAQGTITITGYKGSRNNLIIPETISGVRVTEISNFDGYHEGKVYYTTPHSLTSVVIPNTVTSIGEEVFKDQEFLRSVKLPDTISVINHGMFHGCKSLASITIPSSVTGIGANAFNGCALASITLPNRLVSIGDGAFRNNPITAVQLPATLKAVGGGAFYNNKITNLVIPVSVQLLSAYSFGNNPLASVVIPPSLTSDEPYTLASGPLTITSGQMTGFRRAFSKADSYGEENTTFTSITLPANVDDGNMMDGGYYNFEASFINFYKSQGKRAGTYVKNGRIWTVR